MIYDALWAESRDAWLHRLREDTEDIRASDAALSEWDGKTAPRLEDLMKLWGDAV